MQPPANANQTLQVSPEGVKRLMKARGFYTYRDLAAEMGMHPWAVTRTMRTGFNHKTLAALVRVLQPDSIDELLVWSTPTKR